VVVTIHDVLHLAHPEFFPGAVKHFYARGMLAGAMQKARRIIAVSHFSASELARYTKVDPAHITVVHNGVASRWFALPPFPSPRPRPYFLFVGNVKPHKNLVRMIKAFSLAGDSLPDHDLVIVGKKDGFITRDSEAFKAAAAVGSRIVFTGYLEEAALEQYVTHAEALVFPSLYEGFGLPPLEAMAAGCPVIASDIPALRESCGDAAFYCDPLSTKSIADALLSLATISNPERALIVAAGRRQAQRFTWQETARKTLAVLEETAI
jgi:glycosyltransferase involved in cell wall biosynthesis